MRTRLSYLPSTCSFRMTDIWRSFVAQRIAWVNGWSVLFHAATIRQERNSHDLMRDFRDELTGYLENRAICAALERLDLHPGAASVGRNLLRCYELLVERGWLAEAELPLVRAWLVDVEGVAPAATPSTSGLRSVRPV